jgi:hypothetical protein
VLVNSLKEGIVMTIERFLLIDLSPIIYEFVIKRPKKLGEVV